MLVAGCMLPILGFMMLFVVENRNSAPAEGQFASAPEYDRP